MFSFLDDIEKLTGLPFEVLKGGFRIINLSNKSIYVENYKNVITLLSSEVSIKLQKGILLIKGEDLKLKQMDSGSLCIIGNIKSFLVE